MNRNSHRDGDHISEITEDTMDRPLPFNDVSLYKKQKRKVRRLGLLFLFSNLFVVVLTALPLLAKFPDIYKAPLRADWFGYDDVIRIIEPIVALPFQTLIFLETDTISQYTLNDGFDADGVLKIVAFCFCASVYQLGAGYHGAANMFKHSVETLIAEFANSRNDYPILVDIYLWIRNTWEHLISHYTYAAGGILMSFVFAYCFKDFVLQNGIREKSTRFIWVLAAILNSLAIAGVAIQFEYGFYVAFSLIVGFGGTLAFSLYRSGKGLLFGHMIVFQYYLLSYLIALVLIIGYIAKFGFISRNEAGGNGIIDK